MAVRYAALSVCWKVHVCHCNSLGGATWRSLMITGRTDRRTDRQTDRQSATQYAAPPREEGRITNQQNESMKWNVLLQISRENDLKSMHTDMLFLLKNTPHLWQYANRNWQYAVHSVTIGLHSKKLNLRVSPLTDSNWKKTALNNVVPLVRCHFRFQFLKHHLSRSPSLYLLDRPNEWNDNTLI